MKIILAYTISSTMLLLASSAFAQDGASEWKEEPAAQQAPEDPAPAAQPPAKESKKKKAKKTTSATEGKGTSVGDDSGQTVGVENQEPAQVTLLPLLPPLRVRNRLTTEAYTHDAIYFRAGWDMGTIVLTNASSPSPDALLVSSAFGANLGFGWTLGKGVVLGARFGLGLASRPTLRSDGKEYSLRGNMFNLDVQAFADWYVFPKKGFHVETGIGMGFMAYDPMLYDESGKPKVNYIDRIRGASGILGAGYEWWVAKHWSLGVLFRLNWGVYKGQVVDITSMRTIERQDGKGSLMMFGPMIGFTATAN